MKPVYKYCFFRPNFRNQIRSVFLAFSSCTLDEDTIHSTLFVILVFWIFSWHSRIYYDYQFLIVVLEFLWETLNIWECHIVNSKINIVIHVWYVKVCHVKRKVLFLIFLNHIFNLRLVLIFPRSLLPTNCPERREIRFANHVMIPLYNCLWCTVH